MTAKRKKKALRPVNLLLNIVIALLAVVVFFLLYSFITNSLVNKPVDWTTESTEGGRGESGQIIQLDVLNGCGGKGVAQKFTDYLRRRNFDVVQTSNYKTFDVEESLVIDRTGDMEAAKKVAYALGIDEKNIVQQINPDYYLNVSVVIGRDYDKLKPLE